MSPSVLRRFDDISLSGGHPVVLRYADRRDNESHRILVNADTERVQIRTHDLQLGVYIAELDRPWIETSFLFQGFILDSVDDLQKLRESCEYVFIDVNRSTVPLEKASLPPPRTTLQRNAQFRRYGSPVYTDVHPCEQEAPLANRAQAKMVRAMRDAISAVKNHQNINIKTIETAVDPVVESVTRNPDALVLLSRMQDKGNYLYSHAVGVSVLAVAFGRHLGLQRDMLNSLAIGGMLIDVGKTRLPDSILNDPGPLSPPEYAQAQKHVEMGLEVLEKADGIGKDVLTMVRFHHERHDGSGYPDGLQGAEIPPLGKIAGLVDCFDAMTSARGYGKRVSMHEALNHLNRECDCKFDGALVEQFIQALGIYPTGSIVQLSDGSVGAVIEQNRLRRLQPRVLLILGPDKQPVAKPHAVDLLHESELLGKQAIKIVDCLEADAYGIDANDLFRIE